MWGFKSSSHCNVKNNFKNNFNNVELARLGW